MAANGVADGDVAAATGWLQDKLSGGGVAGGQLLGSTTLGCSAKLNDGAAVKTDGVEALVTAERRRQRPRTTTWWTAWPRRKITTAGGGRPRILAVERCGGRRRGGGDELGCGRSSVNGGVDGLNTAVSQVLRGR